LFVLCVCAPARAQDRLNPDVLVPEGKAPTLDGRVQEGEWTDGYPYTFQRRDQVFGGGHIKRVARDLYISLTSDVSVYGLSIRMGVMDPASRRRVHLDITPLNPPKPPLMAIAIRPDGRSQRKAIETCDLRYTIDKNGGFELEMRLPLDVLEIGRPVKTYRFFIQLFSMLDRRGIAAFPQTAQDALIRKKLARLMPERNWGAEVKEVRPPVNEALKILEELWREFAEPSPGSSLLKHHLGIEHGRRNDKEIAKLETRLKELLKTYPEYAALYGNLMRTQIGRSDFEATRQTLEAMVSETPLLATSPYVRGFDIRLLRDVGRYDEALQELGKHRKLFVSQQAFLEQLETDLVALRDNWNLELEYRKRDAAKGDLPRVELATNVGKIVLELFEDDAPNAVANFVSLVQSGAYDGTRIHWSSAALRVEGGDPNSRNESPHDDGFGDAGYLIETEIGRRLHFPFTIAFADRWKSRSRDPDARWPRTQGSNFMISIEPGQIWDGRTTVFGRVVQGEDVVRKLSYYDVIEKAKVVRKRDHAYKPVKRSKQ
jgi:cyclophilin family peptidyl-prolyl cis-trans isomerase